MSDMKVSLVIRGDGKGARRAAQDAQSGLREMGKTAKSAGDQVKKAAAEQSAAVRATGIKASVALGDVKKAGLGAGAAIKRGMEEGTREERRAGDEAERLGDRIKRSLRRIGDAGGAFRIMGRAAASEIGRIKSLFGSLQGRLASMGLGLAVGREIGASATLDRKLLRTRQTAGMTRDQQEELRVNLWKLARDNGNPLDSLTGGFDKLVASGLSYEASKQTIGAIDVGTTITGADSEVLASGLLTSASAYDFDLSKPGQALELLEKMTVAGRAGNAELEHLSDIFANVGRDAKDGGMGFDQSLAMIETLSLLERQPERLGTLAKSTTRLFTDRNYMVEAAKATGVRFFNKDQSRRDMLDVLGEMKTKYDRLKTDKQRMNFVSKAFGKADQDTRKGVQFLLGGNNLAKFRQIQTDIGNAKGVAAKDLEENRQSTTAVAGRMRNTLREAMDRMAQPINKAMADAGSYLLDDLNLSGGQMIGLAAGSAVAGHYAGRLGKFGLGKLGALVGGGADTVKNIAVGKALQDATGVMPVYVTNWSGAPEGGVGAVPAAVSGSMIKALMAAWGLPAAGVAGIYALHETAKDYGEATEAAQGDAAATRWSQGGRYDTLQPVGETRRLSEGEVVARQAVAQQHPYGSWYQEHRQNYRWYENGRPINDWKSWVAEQAGRVPPEPAAAASPQAMAQQVQQAAQVLDAARRGLESLLGKPLHIQVSADMPWLHAELGRGVERDARRGP